MRSLVLAAALAAFSSWIPAGEAPPRIMPLSDEQIKAELAKETPEQKKLREELAALAKAGQRIFFDANISGKDRDILVAGCDGSDVKRLTKDAGDNWYPHCSPDGKLVAFTSHRLLLEKGKPAPEALRSLPVDPKFPLPGTGKWDRAKPGNGVIWTMSAVDGSDQKPVAFGTEPHWSPDGKFLAYCQNVYPEQLAILNVEKKTEACFEHPAIRNCGMPCFSPDGNHVIGADGGAHCIKLNADRNGVENVYVFDRGHPCNGEVSPDGKLWVHVIDTSGDQGGWLCYHEIDYVKPGGGAKRLNLGWKPNSVNYYPCFSPDGKYLAYVHAEQQPGVKSWELKHDQEIYVTRFPNCEATVRVTWNGAGNREFKDGQGEWEATLGYLASRDDNRADCTTATIETCYGTSSTSALTASGTAFYRLKADWFVMGTLELARRTLTTLDGATTVSNPAVIATTAFARIAYRF